FPRAPGGRMTRTAAETASALRAGTLKPTAVAEEALARAAEREPDVHAFLHLRSADEVLAQARRLEREPRSSWGPLAGVPVALKDNLCTRDMPTTCASRILEGYRPPYDATAVAR